MNVKISQKGGVVGKILIDVDAYELHLLQEVLEFALDHNMSETLGKLNRLRNMQNEVSNKKRKLFY